MQEVAEILQQMLSAELSLRLWVTNAGLTFLAAAVMFAAGISLWIKYLLEPSNKLKHFWPATVMMCVSVLYIGRLLEPYIPQSSWAHLILGLIGACVMLPLYAWLFRKLRP